MDIFGIPVRGWAAIVAGVVLLVVAAVVAWKALGISIVLQVAPLPGSPK